MKDPQTHNQSELIEADDKVWQLLENASEQQAGPMFSRDVVRAIKLSEDSSPAWWTSLFSFKGLALASTAAALTLLVTLQLTTTPVEPSPSLTSTTPTENVVESIENSYSELDLIVEDEDFASEFLIAMAQSPEAFASADVIEFVGL